MRFILNFLFSIGHKGYLFKKRHKGHICFSHTPQVSRFSWSSPDFPPHLPFSTFHSLLKTYIKITIFNGCVIIKFSQKSPKRPSIGVKNSKTFSGALSVVSRNDLKANLLWSYYKLFSYVLLSSVLAWFFLSQFFQKTKKATKQDEGWGMNLRPGNVAFISCVF